MRRDKRVCGKDKAFVLFFLLRWDWLKSLYTLIRRIP